VTVAISGEELGKKVSEAIQGAVIAGDKGFLLVDSTKIAQVADYLKATAGLEFDYLTVMTAVDYLDYFEIIYRLVSLKNNHSLILKTRVSGRENPVIPSVYNTWRAADYQEREIFDLFGIKFEGHPNLKRLLLWDGFDGHPLRRDYL
jgi:NADH-quinone oxidoreductase subunit C